MSNDPARAHRFIVRALIAALAVSTLFLADRGYAQGTNGMLPGPISSHDLAAWAEQLQLTDRQRQAIEPFHEAYRESFRQLREGEIEAYLQEVGGQMGRGFRSLNREGIKDSLGKLERLMARIALLDDSLFNNMQSVLSDEQIVRLPQIMQARKRQRYSSGATRMVGGANAAARVDLTRLYRDLDLEPGGREAADQIMAQYGDRLTAATKDLYEATTQMFLVVVESLENQGVSLETLGRGGPPPRDMMDAMRNAWMEASTKPREKAAAISDLNAQTLRRVAEFLPADAKATLRDRYQARAYAEVPRASQSQAARAFQAALRLPGLSPDMQADVTAMAVEFRASAEPIVDEMIKAVDEYRANWSPWDRGSDARDEYNRKLESGRERLAALDKSAVGSLEALLGPDLAGSVQVAAAEMKAGEEQDRQGDRRGRRGGESGDVEATEAFIAGLGPDPYLPGPITSRDVAAYRERLQLGENEQFILKSLHEEYIGEFNRIQRTDVQTLRSALAQAWPPRRDDADENAEPPAPPTAQQIDDIYDLREKALTSILALDATFFEDVETLVAAPDQAPLVQRLRAARQRSVYDRGLQDNSTGAMFWRRGGRGRRGGPRGAGMEASSNENGVDLARLVEDLKLSADDAAKMNKLLAEYETAAIDGFRRQYESAMHLRKAAEKLRAEQSAARRQGERRDRQAMRSRWEAYQRLSENEGAQATADRKFMIELNRTSLASLLEALPAAQAEALRTAYKYAAFPTVYDDPHGAGRYLEIALQLRDVGDDQRSRITEIVGAYRAAHDEVGDKIAEIYKVQADPDTARWDRERWTKFMEQRNQLEVLAFERDELNAKALRQLREVLTDEQEARLHLPDEVDPDAEDDRL
jgi:Spy/CpxP family protein refolding chaperone